MSKSGFAKDILKSFMERIERLEEEKAALAADIREVYAEAKGSGFDTKIMRKVIALRKLDSADFQEQQAILDLYLTAVGMSGTPLGAYAERQAPVRAAAAPKHPTTNYDLETGEITGDPPPAPSAKVAKPAAARGLAKATKEFLSVVGEPVELTQAEKDKGVAVAFEKDGTRMSIGAVTPTPAESAPGELPAFLDRRIKKPAKVLEAAE